MAVTQKDIAQALNVSQGMVSGVLGNKPNVWASAANRQMILDHARRMGYQPNTAARRLRRGTSETVGLIVFNPGHVTTAETGDIVTVLAAFLDDHGYDLKLKIFTDLGPLLSGLATLVQAKSCDVFILCSPTPALPRQVALLDELKASYIVIGSLEEEASACPQIDFDHPWLMRVCVEHLAARGHRRIAFLGHDNEELYARRLRQSFQQLCQETFGRDCDDTLIGRASVYPDNGVAEFVSGWTALPPDCRPTGIVMAASDNISWRGLEVSLARQGLRIGDGPHDIAVVGLHISEEPLLLGDAHAFHDTTLSNLAKRLCEVLLMPMLTGHRPEESHIRVRPPLEPLASLHLLEQAIIPRN